MSDESGLTRFLQGTLERIVGGELSLETLSNPLYRGWWTRWKRRRRQSTVPNGRSRLLRGPHPRQRRAAGVPLPLADGRNHHPR
jgi:hypothetical protein